MDPVAHDGADAEFAHLPRRVSDDPVIIFKHDAKAAIGQNFIDHAFERQQLFLGQGLSQPPKGLPQPFCRRGRLRLHN